MLTPALNLLSPLLQGSCPHFFRKLFKSHVITEAFSDHGLPNNVSILTLAPSLPPRLFFSAHLVTPTITVFMWLSSSRPPPPHCKCHESRDLYAFCLQLCAECLEQCLVHRECSVNMVWMCAVTAITGLDSCSSLLTHLPYSVPSAHTNQDGCYDCLLRTGRVPAQQAWGLSSKASATEKKEKRIGIVI
jgi:hypothetical protein